MSIAIVGFIGLLLPGLAAPPLHGSLLMLAAGIGSEVQIETDGAQEQEAMNALVALINDKFGEGE